MKPRILLADDHKIVLDGLKSLLTASFEVAGTASDGRTLLDEAERLRPDAIVADISMPMLNGIDAVKQLAERGVTAKIVFLTMHAEPAYLLRAIQAGASGYVLKHAAPEELIDAIHAALAGRRYVSPALRTPAIQERLDPTRPGARRTLELTARQREVLQLLAEGKSAKEIGGVLGISARTVETHKYKMMDDLGVKTSAELVQAAVREGLISP